MEATPNSRIVSAVTNSPGNQAATRAAHKVIRASAAGRAAANAAKVISALKVRPTGRVAAALKVAMVRKAMARKPVGERKVVSKAAAMAAAAMAPSMAAMARKAMARAAVVTAADKAR